MQTGKILGIGAALSAGLLAAQVASASVVTGVEVGYTVGTSAPATYIDASGFTGGGVFYSTGSSGYGVGSSTPTSDTALFSWRTMNLSSPSADSLGLSVVDLQFFGSPGYTANFLATGTGFTALAPNTNTLIATGGGGYSTARGSTAFGVYYDGFAAKSNASYDTTGDATGSGVLDGSGGSSYDASSTTNDALGDLAAPYSLSYEMQVMALSVSSGDYLGTTAAPLGGTVSILGGVANAVALPGTGPLTLVGGLVLVGGLAIRRRMKA